MHLLLVVEPYHLDDFVLHDSDEPQVLHAESAPLFERFLLELIYMLTHFPLTVILWNCGRICVLSRSYRTPMTSRRLTSLPLQPC